MHSSTALWVFFSFFIHSTELFKNNEVMPFLTAPDADVMNISFFPLLNLKPSTRAVVLERIPRIDTDHLRIFFMDQDHDCL